MFSSFCLPASLQPQIAWPLSKVVSGAHLVVDVDQKDDLKVHLIVSRHEDLLYAGLASPAARPADERIHSRS